MKKVIKFFEWIDQFSVPISFRYKKEDSYSTCLGGLVSVIFFLIAGGFGIYYFIPFCQRKNYSLYYYTINLNQTEEINLYKSKSAIAFELECSGDDSIEEKYNELNISKDDVFEFKMRYIFYENNGTHIEKNRTTYISFSTCNENHFFNNRDILKYISKEKLKNLTCIDNLDEVIKNRYQDRYDNFTYFQIDIKAKNDTNNSFIRKYLQDYDCKVELYYTDVKIEIDDYSEPVKPFLNEVFLQLNPNMISKMNAFFMNEYFESVNDLFFPSKGIDKINNLFSRTEQYFIYKDSNDDEKDLANIYIRADTRKMEIKRKYQTVLEFFADSFCFWGDVFIICQIIFTAYNKVNLDYYIEKEVFFFKGMMNAHLKFDKNSNEYKKLKKLIEKEKLIEKNNIPYPLYQRKRKESKIDNTRETIYNYENNMSNQEIKNIKINFEQSINNSNNNVNDNNINTNRNNKSKCKFCKYIWNTIKMAFIKLFELFTCKKCRQKICNRIYKDKIRLLSKAENIINDKLNIISYIKNMIILDTFHNDVNNTMKVVYKLLSMPVISLDDDETNDDEMSKKSIISKIHNRCFSNIDIDNFPITYENLLQANDKTVIQFVGNQLVEIFKNI